MTYRKKCAARLSPFPEQRVFRLTVHTIGGQASRLQDRSGVGTVIRLCAIEARDLAIDLGRRSVPDPPSDNGIDEEDGYRYILEERCSLKSAENPAQFLLRTSGSPLTSRFGVARAASDEWKERERERECTFSGTLHADCICCARRNSCNTLALFCSPTPYAIPSRSELTAKRTKTSQVSSSNDGLRQRRRSWNVRFFDNYPIKEWINRWNLLIIFSKEDYNVARKSRQASCRLTK